MKQVLIVRQVTPRVLVGVARGRPGVQGIQGIAGVSTANAYIDGSKHLILVLDNGAEFDTGELPSVGEIAQLQIDTAALGDALSKHIVTGPGAPSVAPPALGAHYVDTSNGQLYGSKGTATVADWVKLTGFAIDHLQIDADQHLIAHYSDGSSADLGLVRGNAGPAGVGISSVAINASRRLIVTYTNGATQDAGGVPSISQITALQDTVEAQQQSITALQQSLAALATRVSALEGGGGGVPAGTLTDNDGQTLTDQNGNYLTI